MKTTLEVNNSPPPCKQVEPVVFQGKLGFTLEFEGKEWDAFKEEARQR